MTVLPGLQEARPVMGEHCGEKISVVIQTYSRGREEEESKARLALG